MYTQNSNGFSLSASLRHCALLIGATITYTQHLYTLSQLFRLLAQSQCQSVQLLECTPDGKNFCVTWSDGEQSRYHSMWLRHNCQCPDCWDPCSNLKRAAVDKLQGNPVISSVPVLSGN